MHSDVQPPTYASDMRILMENMQALNVNHRQDELLVNSASLKEKEHRSMIPVRHHTSHMYHSRTHQAEPSDVRDLSWKKELRHDFVFSLRDKFRVFLTHPIVRKQSTRRSTLLIIPLHRKISDSMLYVVY